MTNEEAIAAETIAVSECRRLIGEMAPHMQWVWHWGDGEGGWLLEEIREVARASGGRFFTIEADRQPSRPPISRTLRKQVFERDAYRCVDCGGWTDLSCDHVIPYSAGGPTTLENLSTRCMPCNLAKGTTMPPGGEP